MLQTLIQQIGTANDEKTTLVVGLQGDNADEINQAWNSFSNHGATKQDELQDLGNPDKFCYFWSTTEMLLTAMEKAELFRLLYKADSALNRYYDPTKELTEITTALEQKAKEIAKIKFDSLPRERFLNSISRAELEEFI